MDEFDGLSPTALAFGRLAIGVLAAVTMGSAAALTLALAILAAAPRRVPGLPYGDVPTALSAIGTAAALACLASASAYFAQVAHAKAHAQVARRMNSATIALMTAAYLSFAAGGVAFGHFCLAATPVLAHADVKAS